MQSPGDRIEIGGVIGETFATYRDNFLVLFNSAAVIFAIVGLVQGLVADTGSLLLVLLGSAVAVLGTTLYTGFVVTLVEDVRDGRRDFTVGQLLSSVRDALVALIGNGLLKGIAVAIGFALLIVPGLVLLTIWAVTAPAIVLERRGPLEAFGRSRELVRGHGWEVFGVIVVAVLITAGIGLAFALVGAAAGEAADVLLSVISSILTAPIAALVSAILFFELGGGRRSGTEMFGPAATG